MHVSYGLHGVGGPFLQRATPGVIGSEVAQTIPGGIGDAFGSLFRNNYPRWKVSINLSYPLGTSAAQASVARGRLQIAQANAKIRQIEMQIAAEVTNAAIQARMAVEAVQAARAVRELAQQKLDTEESKFAVGLSTNYFVVQAQRDLADAANGELRSILNHRKALVEFDRLQQTTLQSDNVTLVNAGGASRPPRSASGF
jgi:outer membrane protein TolC